MTCPPSPSSISLDSDDNGGDNVGDDVGGDDAGCRLLRDPGISRDPGIFSKSRSPESQKSNPGIFRDFQNP